VHQSHSRVRLLLPLLFDQTWQMAPGLPKAAAQQLLQALGAVRPNLLEPPAAAAVVG
jgi:hypothetical protein